MPSSPEPGPDDAAAPTAPPRGRWLAYLSILGPGLAIAATGVGAGDMVAAAVSGSRFGIAVAWAALAGALLKFVLNEGLARWQLATGTTLLEGWVAHLGRWVQYAFLVYLVIWSFVVGGALISACGMAAHALVPALPVEAWGALHSLVAAALVLIGGYATFERLVKWFVGLMFVTLVGCAALVASPAATLASTVVEAAVPSGGAVFIVGVMGGVGGSVTLLSYGYWIREKRWEGASWIRVVRLDLAVAYVLTGVFGLAVVVLAAHLLHAGGETTIRGSRGVVQMAGMLEGVIGATGRWTFLIGFWGAVSTSLLGVWQGVPYLFADFVGLMKGLSPDRRRALMNVRSVWYRGYLAWLALPPLALLIFERPVMLIVVYSVMGALFMPFLAATLLYLNSRRDLVGAGLSTGWIGTTLLLLCLALFGYLAVDELIGAVWRL
jgi:Mn2+/Fe2+ NRAMP family transporter